MHILSESVKIQLAARSLTLPIMFVVPFTYCHTFGNMKLTFVSAFQAWEHYSSIRNINGPMTGLPHVQVIEPDEEDSATDDTSSATHGPDPGKVKAVNGFLPHIIDEAAIVKALEECSGNANSAVNKLLDADYISSQPSTPVQSSPGSSSVERDSDSDDEESRRPAKRQNRSRKADKAATAENEKIMNEVTFMSGSPSTGLREDSDESIRGSTRRRERVIKAAKAFRKEKEERKRLAELTAASSTAAPSTASPSTAAAYMHLTTPAYIDLTTSDSEFEPEPELPVKPLQPDNTSSELPLSKIKSEAEDEVALPQSLSTKVKLATSEFKNEDEADRIAQFDGEADDEYRLDGEDDIESDFEEPISPTSPTTPATPPSSPGSASSRKEPKTIPSANRVQKSPRKDGKRSKPSRKLLDSTIKSLNSNGTLSPVKKAVGMKVLFI